MNTTAHNDVISVAPEEITAAVIRVHDENKEMASVLEALSDAEGVALCTVVAGAFTPDFNAHDLFSAVIDYKHAVFHHDSFVSWRIPMAIVVDMIAHGADSKAAGRLTKAGC